MIELVKQGVNSRIEDLGLHARRPVTEQGAEQRDGGLLLVAAQQAHDAVRKDGAMRSVPLCAIQPSSSTMMRSASRTVDR